MSKDYLKNAGLGTKVINIGIDSDPAHGAPRAAKATHRLRSVTIGGSFRRSLRLPYAGPPHSVSRAYAGRRSYRGPHQGTRTMDIVYLAVGIGFFAVMAGYARWAAKA